MQEPLKPSRKGFVPELAFVVHLAEVGSARGRVEHVASGRSLHFDSTAELMSFMQRTIEDGASTGDATESA